jgi:hypothetical protein
MPPPPPVAYTRAGAAAILGYAADRVLLYATGGGVYGDSSLSGNVSTVGPFSNSTTFWSWTFLVAGIDVEVPRGRCLGELGFIAPKNMRTQTVKCIEDGDVLTITYEKLLELYF